MILGHGDLASVLPNRADLLFFACGVSNSQEKRESEYKREERLLIKQNPKAHLVYFSSLSIFYNNNRYTQHKRYMECIVRNYFDTYTIIRLGNISFGKNPHTIINYFKKRLKNQKPLIIENDYRYIVNKLELLHWINLIPEWSCEMNIPGKMMTVEQIVKEIKKGKL